MRPRTIGVMVGREMRCALREKSIVVNSLLIPLLLYPFLLWGAFTVISIVDSRTQGISFALALPPGLLADGRLRALLPKWDISMDSAGTAGPALLSGSVDAAVELRGDTDGFLGRPPVTVTYDASRERGRLASGRARQALTDERREWLPHILSARGISGRDWAVYSIRMVNVAGGRRMGAFMLGLIIPVAFMVMTSVGCFYPAIDSFAGERERQTWETTLSTSASRLEILASKFLYVSAFGLASGLLNMGMMLASVSAVLGPAIRSAGENASFAIPAASIPFLGLGAILISMFLATGMIFFGALARTYREGQAMITPFYMATVVPVVFLQSPGLDYTTTLAAIPVVNVAMMIRAALSAPPALLPVLLTVVVTVAFTVAGLAASSRLMGMEESLTGRPDGARLSVFRLLRKASRRVPHV